MIFFLYGPDTYRSKQKLQEIVLKYKKVHKSGLNLRYCDCQEVSFQDFEDGARQASMFQEKKLIVATNVFSNKEFKEHFLEKIDSFSASENILVVYADQKISAKDSLLTVLKKKAKYQRFDLLKGANLKSWIRREFKRRNADIDLRALDKLVVFVGNDLWRMSNEIQKLAAYREEGRIAERDVGLLVRPDIETDIFKTIDAIASKNKKKALVLIKRHLEKGDNPFYLLSMINYQFRNLIQIKDLILRGLSPFKQSGLHPFVVKKSRSLSGKFDIKDLKKIYQKIFEVDLDVKTGKINPQAALDILIAEI